MARISVRYLVTMRGGPGKLPRYFWQPSSALREQGWRPQRVPENWAGYSDPAALEAAAVARAQELNAQLDAARSAAPATPAAPPIAGRTLADLIKAYQASKSFTSLAPATQRGYRQCLTKLELWGGDAPVRAIDAPRVQRLKQGLAATPAYANAVVRVLRLLLEFSRREGWVTHNAATRPDLEGTEPAGIIWPREAVAAFVLQADAMGLHSVGTAVLLNEWLGQRKEDILRMPRNVIRPGGLVIRQSKRGAGVVLPIGMVPHLQLRLDQELARIRKREEKPGAIPATTIIVCEATGAPYSEYTFSDTFARIRAKLGLTTPSFDIEHLLPGRDMTDADAFKVHTADLTFRALRHTAITRLAEAECDAALICSISGHSLVTVHALMKRYLVRTAKLARLAFGKRMAAEALPAADDAGEVDVAG